MEALVRQSCAEHPDRHAHATCMSCRRILCHECTTQWEGIHYCRACVGALAAAPVVRATPFRLIMMLAVSAALAFVLIRVAVGLGVYIAGMF